jgi:hypothetical protein
MGTEKVGDTVWYNVGTTKEQAEIIDITDKTGATIRIQTGPQAGQEIEAPWGVIQALDEE